MFAGLPAILVIAARRLAAQRGLALAASLGLVAAVALTLSIPLYADAVYHRIFLQQVLADGQAAGGAATRPPFAFLFEYEGAWDGGLQWEAIQPVDAYLSSQAPAGLGLPQELGVRHFRTDVLKLFPYDDAQYADTRDPLTWVHFSYLEDLEAHATVLEGRFPRPAGPASTEPVEALASQALATRLGLQVGELYITFQRSPAPGNRIIQIPVAIAGLWQPAEPADDYWCCPNAALEDLLFVPEATFRDRISRDLDDEIYVAEWYLIMNAADVHTNDAGPLAARIRSVWQRAATLLPNTRLTVSPLENLENYQRTAAALTVLLYAFSVPILGLVLAFVSLTAGLTAEGQRGEMAVLRSRGATVFQVAGIAVLESLLLGSIGLALGWPAGQLAARLIGSARSFLDFSAAPDLRVVMTPPALGFGLAALALALVAYVVPTLSAARHTVITFKQERARLLRAAWWQRAGLDLLLLALAGYGFYVLRRQGGLTLALPGGPAGGDPFQNPLLFLVPALAGAALTLAVLRVVPAAAGGAAWLIGRTRSIGLLLAARHLARTPGSYYPPLALLVLTLNLSVYTASLAQTLDDHLVAQTYYAIGADMRVDELGELTGNPDSGFGPAEADGGGARWLLLPVAEYLNVPEVRAATRVGEYMASAQLGGSHQAGTFVGIDRLDFPQVAYWRRDFAPESLGALMNRLALNWNGVLVPRDLLASHALGVGDPLRISVNLPSRLIHLDVTIAGAFDLFPGWDPADGWVYVGNLGYLFESAGTEYPSSVWMRTAPQAAPEAIADGMRQLGVSVLDWQAAVPQVQAEQSRPERQGLFGLLSVGFVASAVLTVVGFGLYALFSSRRRFIELGVLRAMGLSSRQMGTFVAWELGILIVTGLAAGTAIGVWLSREFIPHLQIQAGPAASLPPFVVVIAWPAVLQMYALFGLLFVGTLATLAASLRRMRVFESVKLGEAT